MNYFNKFPTVIYDFPSKNKQVSYLLKDITTNVRFRKEIFKDITLYDEYDIMDGETPEIIAEKVYGSPYYNWVVMLANDRYNYVEDFPMSSYELDEYVIDKYGSIQSAMQKIKYYVNSEGEIVYYNKDTPHLNYKDGPIIEINCYDFEVMLNESKRRIKLISPNLLSVVVKNLEELI